MFRALVTALVISSTTAADATVGFRMIAKGTNSRFSVHREFVVRRAAPWHLTWYEHTGSHEPPAVDFDREMVVGVFAGKRPAGDSVEIVSVTREGNDLAVRYREHTASGGRAVSTPATVSPFHIVAIPSDAATIKFIAVTPS
jgi:hypothetical protein